MNASVLIVDDAEFMRAMLREIVSEMGWTIAGEASDGESAVRLFSELRPQLVALDLTMPRLDGIGALKQILAIDAGATVVMITALGQRQKVLESIQCGARDFLIKPFDPERVKATLERLIAEPVA